ncbi:zymogen granule membrane protein 16-like [Dunckerocampus dactyliophorus]|uniref:zymogen granule membrane protein 16-like n=1 Tax=Dunckerocampus dactyliophorus TaxID=161453 RepID=UPI002406E4F9|nr:zymogen granule membrane protein 16-like [Dunckerocampus dactyliophorus]XP_054620009.1 zymogen granule membrane protein 16-like [Dunckerocampus dactyliophorus]
MHNIVVVTLLMFSIFSDVQPQKYSYSEPVGSGGGDTFSITGEGRITAVRVWEQYNNLITGLQLRYGHIWSPAVGSRVGALKDFELYDGEAIVQISGKFTSSVQSVVFVTNLGRFLQAGQPRGNSFNMYPTSKEAELRIISGQVRNGFTSFGAHWAAVQELHF